MPANGYFIDANLLVLLVVGSVNIDAVARHRRLKEYTPEDYLILSNLIGQVERVLVTPNTLTETSNLLGQHGEPERSQFFERLRSLIEESEEIVVDSAAASRHDTFTRLGLTDAALLEVATEETPIVTVDVDLYLAAASSNPYSAINFTHLRNLWP
jgi:predicted nucleic acid-binding protein